MKRVWFWGTFAALALNAVINIPSAFALPTGFSNQLITGGLSLPTDFASAPDGRIFIAQKNGSILVFKNNQLLSSPALSMTISTGGDRGLLSMALDPNFSANGYVYLLYTTIGNHQRISRFTMAGDTISSTTEKVLLENPEVWSGFLNAGAVRFGPDGKIYASFGSNGGGMIAQDLSTLDGKFVRLNADGTIPADNPFVNLPGAQPSIYAYGFRNPWRFNFGSDGKALIGDVGEDTYEKIVRAEPGANFGWPTFEGNCIPNCNGITPPLYVYPHNGAGAAVVGGDTNHGTNFPTSFSNNYFFGDYVQGYLKAMDIDFLNGDVHSVQDFASGLGSLAAINMGPDGCLYYLTIFPGTFHKICYNAPSTVTAQAGVDKISGTLPLAVQFNSTGSGDSSGAEVNYAWDFGDGTSGTGSNPMHTYTSKGIYKITLTVSNAGGSATSNLTVWGGYLPPSATINNPNAVWSAGDTISFSANASDPQDGPMPASAFFWRIIFHHNTHIHPPVEIVGQTSGTFMIPTELHTETTDLAYEFQLTVTDSAGLSTTISRTIQPNIVNLVIDSNPSGIGLLLDSQPITTPYTAAAIPGYLRSLGAPAPAIVGNASYNFSSWSDGGTQTHTFAMPTTSASYDVTYQAGPSAAPAITSAVTLDHTSYAPGAIVNGTLTISSNTSLGGVIVDAELWNGAQKIGQFFTTANIIAGQELTLTHTDTATSTPGNYTIKIGIFKGDWSTLYSWNDNAATLVIGSSTTTPPSPPQNFVIGATASSTNPAAGSSFAINALVNAPQNLNNVIVDTEIWGSGGKVLQNVINTNLTAGVVYQTPWTITAPGAGAYTIKVGVFAGDWSSLFSWNDAALTFTTSDASTTPPPPPATSVTSSVTANPAAPSAGTALALTTSIQSSQPLGMAHIDTEMWKDGVKVAQSFTSQYIASGNTTTVWNTTAPQNGVYTMKVGIFSPDWSHVYHWNDNALSLTIGNSTPPSPPPANPSFALSITASSTVYQGGTPATFTSNIVSTADLPNVLMDTEIDDPSGVLLIQNVVPVNLIANQLFKSDWNVVLPSTAGQYGMKIGIFSQDWSKEYFFKSGAYQFTIGSPLPPPAPGATYPITIVAPGNGADVSGIVEAKSYLQGLDINSYTIAWRTGTGIFFTLDTDPVTKSIKHAWIDFSAWNWNANQLYPLEFQATDVHGNVIGDQGITVHVVH